MLGKYAEFIIPAYGITALVLGYLVVSSLFHARNWKRRAEQESAGRDSARQESARQESGR